MKLLSIFKRRKSIEQRLFERLHPDPASREKRLSQWSRERQQRYFDACFGTPQSLQKRGKA
jgi:hypothetical protein